ncbi:MAG: hypothetical protein ACREX9_03350 [Gammaproteobacteria bacterium]
MATRAQAARANIKKAQETWRQMSSRARARAQPEGRGRAKPGATGRGEYYHIEVRPSSEFRTFRTQDVGGKGGIERVAGKRSSGSWDTQKWLISKAHAHVEDGRIVADTSDAKQVLCDLGSKPRHVAGDRFKASPRPDVPEREIPTAAQRRARRQNIRKAQAARQAR